MSTPIPSQRPPLPDPSTLDSGGIPARKPKQRRRSRIELYREHALTTVSGRGLGSLEYRWRLVHANGHKIGQGGHPHNRRVDSLANARAVTGFDLANRPDEERELPGVDGKVEVWFVNLTSRRGFPG